jgi:hypothetical protein
VDDKRFDGLTRAIARGASRRSVLKGLLGLGGAAITGTIAANGTDARTAGTRVSIPPPPPPECPSGTGKCADGSCCPYGRCYDGHCCPYDGTEWCGTVCCGEGQCTTSGGCCEPPDVPCGSICCPSGTCTRLGNTDQCCIEGAVCGLECCATEDQCCDRECCPDSAACLARIYGETAGIGEERCCDIDQICEGQCCDGACYHPAVTVNGGLIINGTDLFFERFCCPAGHELCVGDFGTDCCLTNEVCGQDGVCQAATTTTAAPTTTTAAPTTTTAAPTTTTGSPGTTTTTPPATTTTPPPTCFPSCLGDSECEQCIDGFCRLVNQGGPCGIGGRGVCDGDECVQCISAAHCENWGYDEECVECIDSTCLFAPPFHPCNNALDYCASGICEPCLGLGATCQSPNQCCSDSCGPNNTCA